MLLAKEVAHTVKVDEMLDSLTPRQFKEWVAFYNIISPKQEQEQQKPTALGAMRQLAGV